MSTHTDNDHKNLAADYFFLRKQEARHLRKYVVDEYIEDDDNDRNHKLVFLSIVTKNN